MTGLPTLARSQPSAMRSCMWQQLGEYREASPTAKISAGPTGPQGSVAPITFMNIAIPEMQRLGGNGLLDAWSHNPYPPSVRGPRTGKTKPPYIYIGNLSALVKTLDSYSMTKRKPVWATEFAYQTNPPDKNLGISYSLQATFLAEVYDMLASTSRVQMGFWYVFRDNTLDSDWQSGLQNSKGKKKDSYSMYARPISRSTESVKPGKSVRIWGASAVDPRSARIMYSYDKRKWKRAPKEKALGNGTRAMVMSPSKTVYYRITDAKGSGPMRGVKVR